MYSTYKGLIYEVVLLEIFNFNPAFSYNDDTHNSSLNMNELQLNAMQCKLFFFFETIQAK